jgi:hypothetical protein
VPSSCVSFLSAPIITIKVIADNVYLKHVI